MKYEIIQLGVHGEVAPTGSCAIFFLGDLLLLHLHQDKQEGGGEESLVLQEEDQLLTNGDQW